MKKIISLLLVLVVVIGIFSGCGDNSKSSSNQDTTTIRFSFWEGGVEQEQEIALGKIIAEYNKIHPEVKVELLSQPNSGYQEWLKSKFLSNDAPEIISNHMGEVEKLYKQNYLYDLTEDFNAASPYADNVAWKDTFIDGKLETVHLFKYEPSFAVPYFGMGVAYFYNKDIYNELGLEIPETWDEFMANCEKIQQNNVNPIAMMLMKQDAVNWFTWYISTGLFANEYLADNNFNVNADRVLAGQELVNAVETGVFDIASGKDKERFIKFLEMAEQYSKYCEDASGLDEAGAKAQFLAGQAGHIMTGSWDLKAFLTDPNMNIGVFSLPRFTKDNYEFAGDNFANSSIQALCVSKSDDEAKNKAAADFLKFLTSKDIYKIFVEDTYSIPTVKDMDVPADFMAFTTGSVEPIQLYIEYEKTNVKWNFTNVIVAALSGEKLDKEQLFPDLTKALNERVQSSIEADKLSADNNYGLDDMPKLGEFTPSEAFAK